MNDVMTVMLADYYKAVNGENLPEGITKSVSYYTPRMSRLKTIDKMVHFSLQGFIQTYLIDHFNRNFFSLQESELQEYSRVLNHTLGKGLHNENEIKRLWKLGYLPVEVFSVPEGTLVPMGVPAFGITNTHPSFAWLPQALETLISAEIWHPIISATIGHEYRKIVNKYCELSCDESVVRARLLSDFAFRGQESIQSAIKSSSAWGLSFLNSSNEAAIPYLEKNYDCDCENEDVLFGAVSTEHAVMCSNFAVDGNEETMLKRLLEKYKDTNFSAVLDSYDYDNMLDNILPSMKEEILAHNGCFLVRGDSGDCVEVVTETVFKLWNTFGGELNSKGFKVLDKHVKAIYSDGITLNNICEIYEILVSKGFAVNNVALGVGSFSMQAISEDGVIQPFTRDTFSSCIKATYMEIKGEPYAIFKNPKHGGFKKSHKGMCHVFVDESSGELKVEDGYTRFNLPKNNMLQTVFKNGAFVKKQTLSEIRDVLNGGDF